MNRTILIAAFIIFTSLHIAAKEQYVYTQISQKEGLTSTVNCIYKEKDGKVWIGTPNGLYNFNGYSLKNFGGQIHGSRRVHQIKEDPRGDLWVLTDKHILKRTAGTDRFERISENSGPFFCMSMDAQGIWFGGLKNVFRYSYSERQVESRFTMPAGVECRTICRLDDSTLLCCSHSGDILIDIENGNMVVDPYGRKAVSDMLKDSKGRLWFALYNNGIEVYEKDGTKIRTYNTANSRISNNIVLCLEERDSVILAGTDGGGINIIDPEKNTIEVLSHISGDRFSFPAHSIKSIHIDHYGNIWAGSIRDGLISISRSEINSYKDTHLGLKNGLSNPTVLSLHQDKSSGHIWVGTDGEGLNRFNPKTAEFTHYSSTFKTKVVSIADWSDNELAVSTYADDLWIFNKTSGKMRQMPLADSDRFRRWIKYSGRSINLFNETDGDILLFANTIYRYNQGNGHCTSVAIQDNKSPYSNFLIIGTSSDGVWMHNNTGIYLLKDDSDALILKGIHENGIIHSGHLAADGVIWLATEEGLCGFNTHDDKFFHITTTNFTDASSVICDNNSRVWVGTEKGLSAYLASSERFTLFGESDGVMPNEYLPKPHLLATDGDVYLGGVQGLLHIGAGHVIDDTEDPVLKMSELRIDGSVTELDMEKSSLKIPRYSKTIDIGVSVREKDMFRHRFYRFALSGDKIYETDIPMLSLQQIPNPGTYHLTVSCTRKNGEWTDPVKILTIKVPLPWYMTWWFICACITMLALMFSTALYSINRRKASELKIAIQEQEQKVYEEKVQMLINVSHELRTPLTLIMAPLKRLLKGMEPENEDFNVLSRIYRQSRRMRSLLDMVLDLRKMEVGGNKLNTEKTDFNNWINDLVDDIANEEKAEGINIVYDLDSNVGFAEMDRQKCDIILMNLLINAIKHSSAGDTITIRTARSADGTIRTSISDQGPGLGKDIDLTKMFTMFYQSNSEKYGSGIGLAYSRILVEMHGGNIGVENNPDKGATFWWTIPASVNESSLDTEPRAYLNELLGHSSEADTIISVEDNFSTAGMRLMLVDDSQDLLDFLREALCQDFAEIITVTGGNSALRELAGGKLPDIIVSDVNMPDGDGFKLCNELKHNDKYCHIPIILLTARGEEQSQSESYRIGADGFLAKPFEIETLMEMLRGMLRSKAEIRRKYLDEDASAEAEYGSNEERFILQLNRIIGEHISNPELDQQLICKELGVSRALLYNRMKAITGAGAKEYITKIRIEKAKSLIESTSLTIAEISDMTGFTSQSYFSTAFKNYTGMTPTKYKQENKKQ